MKTVITALGFLIIIGTDFSLRTLDFLSDCDFNIELTKESSSESDTNEKTKKKLGDYFEELVTNLNFKKEIETNKLLAFEFKAIIHHSPWDEIPLPPPEHS